MSIKVKILIPILVFGFCFSTSTVKAQVEPVDDLQDNFEEIKNETLKLEEKLRLREEADNERIENEYQENLKALNEVNSEDIEVNKTGTISKGQELLDNLVIATDMDENYLDRINTNFDDIQRIMKFLSIMVIVQSLLILYLFYFFFRQGEKKK